MIGGNVAPAFIRISAIVFHLKSHCGFSIVLPNKPLVNVSSISETEIWNGYRDPLLTGILGDPEKKSFILRWVNKITPEGRRISSRRRPDAIISIFTQANYVTFGKDTVDSGTTSMVIGFQIHGTKNNRQSILETELCIGFNIQFYLVELKHEALYTMTELGNIQIPDLLNSFSRLLSTDTLDTLVRLNDLV
ncbi:hypothetical protein INT45_014299, partial [Circinella minor]